MSKDKEKNTMELTMKENTDVAVYDEKAMAEWGGSALSPKDIIIPSIILLQANSPQVAEKKGQAGDYIDSVSGENFGNTIKDIVPFHMEKTWTVEKWNGKKYEWDRTDKMTLDNENLPYEFEVGPNKYRRKYTYRYFGLVGDSILPFSIKFKGASKKTGSNLATEMYVKNKMKHLPPAAMMIDVKSEIEKNKDGESYFVSKFVVTKKTPYEKVMEALNWFKTIQKSDEVVIHDADDGDFNGQG
jgi:hypothetical protein